MPKILGTLADREGRILPFTTVAVREANNPTGDNAKAVSDKFGNIEVTVALAGTEYDLWITEETGYETSNYVGKRISSGDVVSSFTLGTDLTWNVEHHPDGKHKATTHDSIKLNASGYFETTDAFSEWRLGSANNKFRITGDGDTVWLEPKPVGGSYTHLGIRNGSGPVTTKFYFGSAKTRYIDSSSGFALGAGAFHGDVNFVERVTFAKRATFANTADEYPRLSTYVAPGSDVYFAPKKYVDDQITANLPLPPSKIYQNDTSVEVIDVGSGQVVTTIDGTVVAVAVGDKFAFGGLFNPTSLFHLRKTGVEVAIRLERLGAGASTLLLGENYVGTHTPTGFYLKSAGINAGIIDASQRFGFGIFTGLTEKINVGGNIQLNGYLNIGTKAVPANPAAEEARIYLKTRDADNNELAAKIKKSGSIQEVLLTSCEGICSVCGKRGSAKDPYFDTVRGRMVITFYCGHSFEIDMNFIPRD